jgi:hypothetical protein
VGRCGDDAAVSDSLEQSPQDRLPPPPRCKAMLLCEKTITDVRSGNTTLVNIFTCP